MDIFEQRQVLDSMVVLVDNREQPTKRAEERYKLFGSPYERATLSYGDYTYNATLPSGKLLFDTSKTIEPLLAVERKMNLDELAYCFTHSRDRFQREFERATANKAQIFLLVENANWENLLNGKYRSLFNAKAFEASVLAWSIRYGLQLIFCKEETSGILIHDILYRDLKERLERGEFDGTERESTN
jgi:ERCC4-type nuclease